MTPQPAWPELPLAMWKDTRDTLHMYAQIVGKIRLALAPEEPEWAGVALFVTARGLTTGPMRYGDRAVQIDFDFVMHRLAVIDSAGKEQAIELRPRTVAAFYQEVMGALRSIGVDVNIRPVPSEVRDPVRFTDDTVHAAYDREHVDRFWRILINADSILKEHRAPFRGRHTSVHFFWGGFDLAYARYSGRPADPPPGADSMMRKAMDAEEIYAGFWFGDERVTEPAFGSYVYPKPEGLEKEPLRPESALWNEKIGLFILRYEDVRTSKTPREDTLAFLASTYDAGSRLAGWHLPA